MVKPLLIIGVFGIALAVVYLIFPRIGYRHKLDHTVELIAYLGAMVLLALIVLLACESSVGSDSIATTVERFVHWLRS